MASLLTGTLSIQGKRDHMEDRFFLDTNFCNQEWVFGGVYDGHGGFEVAEYSQKNLHERFRTSLMSNPPQEAFAMAYDSLSTEVAGMQGGTCATNFLIQGNDLHYANVGDCRIIIVGGETKQLTIDHTVKLEPEKERITRQGGLIRGAYVFIDYRGLAVTRSLGDALHKKIGVISVPDVGTYHIKSTDKYVIAGSDGLFGKVSNEEIALITARGGNAQTIAENLKDAALRAGSGDNITILVVSCR